MVMREVPRERNMGVKSKQVSVDKKVTRLTKRVVSIQVTRMVGSA